MDLPLDISCSRKNRSIKKRNAFQRNSRKQEVRKTSEALFLGIVLGKRYPGSQTDPPGSGSRAGLHQCQSTKPDLLTANSDFKSLSGPSRNKLVPGGSALPLPSLLVAVRSAPFLGFPFLNSNQWKRATHTPMTVTEGCNILQSVEEVDPQREGMKPTGRESQVSSSPDSSNL